MDIMIPYLGQITKLQLQSKGAFHIAGLKESNVTVVEREKRKKRDIKRKDKINKKQLETTQNQKKTEDDEAHLDTWA